MKMQQSAHFLRLRLRFQAESSKPALVFGFWGNLWSTFGPLDPAVPNFGGPLVFHGPLSWPIQWLIPCVVGGFVHPGGKPQALPLSGLWFLGPSGRSRAKTFFAGYSLMGKAREHMGIDIAIAKRYMFIKLHKNGLASSTWLVPHVRRSITWEARWANPGAPKSLLHSADGSGMFIAGGFLAPGGSPSYGWLTTITGG